jgi:hypothetical protein
MKQKDAEVFTITLHDITTHLDKLDKATTDPRTAVPKDYYKFLDVFSKEESDKLLIRIRQSGP